MQTAVQQFKSKCNQAKIFVENEMPIGLFHDFLMEIKGLMVDRMVAAHQEQLAQAEAAKDLPIHESELPTEAVEAVVDIAQPTQSGCCAPAPAPQGE